MRKFFYITIFISLVTCRLVSQNVVTTDPSKAVDKSFFEFIPKVDYGDLLEQNGTTSFTTEYSPSGSYWLDPTDADEEHVYLAKLQHEASTDENSWELRIGQGGQIYSFKSTYGEGIPPQSKEASTWNDEVWQPVSVSALNNRDFTSRFYFIHGAGAYNFDGIEKTWYSPLMASYYDEQEKAYYVSNWGSQAHVPSLYKSEILYTTKYKEIGEGILEVTYIIQNFGEETMVHINAPWGGVRASSLRGKFVGLPDGSIEISNGSTAGEVDTRDIDETGGYVIWSENTTEESAPSLGMVFGNELKKDELSSHGLRNVFFRLGQVGGDANPRDYTLFTVISQINIEQGESFFYRTYYINGTREFVQGKSNLLAPYSDYGFIETSPEETTRAMISTTDVGEALSKGISLFTSFNEDMLPLFLMRNTATGEEYVSPDLYYNAVTAPLENPYDESHEDYELFQDREVYRLHLSEVEYVRLLGYAYTKDLSSNPSFTLLDDLILDESKIVLTEEYKNKIWVKKQTEVTCDLSIIPRTQVYGEATTSSTSVVLTEGDSLIIKPQVTENGVTSTGTGTWTWELSNTNGASGRVLTFEPIIKDEQGIYSVTYQSGSCKESATFDVIVEEKIITGAGHQDFIDVNSVYPNPTLGVIQFLNESEYQVTDAIGNIVARGYGHSVNISNESKGIYFIEISNGNESVVHKVLKQ